MSTLPLFTDGVACGFPSPAQDYVEKRLSLDDLCIRHPESTYLPRANPDYPVIPLSDETETVVFGVVRYCVHAL